MGSDQGRTSLRSLGALSRHLPFGPFLPPPSLRLARPPGDTGWKVEQVEQAWGQIQAGGLGRKGAPRCLWELLTAKSYGPSRGGGRKVPAGRLPPGPQGEGCRASKRRCKPSTHMSERKLH